MTYASTILGKLGTFVQNVVTTNTAKVLVDQGANFYRDFKRWRSAACASAMVLAGAGGVPLFILVPEFHQYFANIIHHILPFIGDVGETIGVGALGFWISAAVAYQLAKEGYREFSLQKNGHTNSEYAITDQKVKELVDANPHIFDYDDEAKVQDKPGAPQSDEDAVAVEMEDGGTVSSKKVTDTAKLKATLEFVRRQLDITKGDGTTSHAEHKKILLSALRTGDLAPLIVKAEAEPVKAETLIKLLTLLKEQAQKSELPENTSKCIKEAGDSKKYPLHAKKNYVDAMSQAKQEKIDGKIEVAVSSQEQKSGFNLNYLVGSAKFLRRLGARAA